MNAELKVIDFGVFFLWGIIWGIIVLVVIGIFRQEAREKIRKNQERQRATDSIIKIHKIQQERRTIEEYPIIRLAQNEFEKIPKAENFIDDWLENTAPVDFRFICKPSKAALIEPKIIVMGQLVKRGDLLGEQFGGCLLDLPQKGINRYQVRITG